VKKPFLCIAFAAAVLLAGFFGFAVASEWLPPARQAAVRVDVDLTQPGAAANAPAVETTPKTHETEPEEVPSPNDIEVEIVLREPEHGAPLRVLIYHTHTYEAYEPDFEGQYKPTERWRTADRQYNVVRVGAELSRILREEYGMVVVHDDTAFEPPRLDNAYTRSLEAIENYTARGETFDLYLDIHRDAYAQGRFAENTVEVDGKPTARVMFLVGKGTGTYKGQAFAQLPSWEINLARARVMTDAINAQADKLCRPVSTSSSRYNQHVSTGAFLLEIGNNMNSLEEALRAVPYAARAIAETAGGLLGVENLPDTQYAVETK